jgi:AAA+ superfamily predicted ATPase
MVVLLKKTIIMNQNNKLKILRSIGKVFESAENCKLEEKFFKKIDSELTFLSEYFKTTKTQAFFIANVFALNYKGNTLDFNDLNEFYKCNPMRLLEYIDDFKFLNELKIFELRKSSHRMSLAESNNQFCINERVTEAILKNEPFPELNKDDFSDIFELLEKISLLTEKRKENKSSTYGMFSEVNRLISKNIHFPIIKKINEMKLGVDDNYVFLYLIWKTISGRKSLDVASTTESIFDTATKRFNYMQKLIGGENQLVKLKLVEIEEARFFNDTEMKLTSQSLEIIKECGIHLLKNKNKNENIIAPSKITSRELIFNETEMQQLFLIKDMMKEENLKNIQNRLSEKNLSKGVVALLHGAPGTGKTEVVKQIAKETNRDIMKVDISQSKSMWFGESEKIIKKIFTDYKSFAEDCDQLPILFFNEADAIISKRKDVNSSTVAQTENIIQNIILEELENFEGILLATTNLVNNLDAAFERRFLFKIKFQKPDISIRAKIWKSKLPSLKMEDCNLLAEKYDFSGGQIDNVFRKKEIHEIINGMKVTLENLLDFCSEETLIDKKTSIGFSKK